MCQIYTHFCNPEDNTIRDHNSLLCLKRWEVPAIAPNSSLKKKIKTKQMVIIQVANKKMQLGVLNSFNSPVARQAFGKNRGAFHGSVTPNTPCQCRWYSVNESLICASCDNRLEYSTARDNDNSSGASQPGSRWQAKLSGDCAASDKRSTWDSYPNYATPTSRHLFFAQDTAAQL